MSRLVSVIFCVVLMHSGSGARAAATEFCLVGVQDLGLRLQGLSPAAGEFYDVRYCVITEDDSPRVRFHGNGNSNPDMHGTFTVAYLPPDRVRILDEDDEQDLDFVGVDSTDEARRNQRMDPLRLLQEIAAGNGAGTNVTNGWHDVDASGGASVRIEVDDGEVRTVNTYANLPLRGRVPVIWRFGVAGSVTIDVDGETFFRGRGERRTLSGDELSRAWRSAADEPPRELPGEYWPSRVAMDLVNITDGVYLVTGVRSGFRHLVVETEEGLVVADAPAGWVEMTQVPPVDLVPGLGVSGLSERMVDFIKQELPGRKFRAVVLTHVHDDHAGGARAFAAEGATVYAPAGVAGYLETALNRSTMPADRLAAMGGSVEIVPVDTSLRLDDSKNPLELLPINSSPHTEHALGVWLPESDLFFQSDLHVPGSDDPEPRQDRLEMECWFAAWATTTLPEDTTVWNSHSSAQTPVSRLARYLETTSCQRFAAR